MDLVSPIAKARLTTAFEEFATEYDRAVSALSDDRRRLLESHRQVLDQTSELPALEQKLSEHQGRLEELLADLADLCDGVADALDEQTALRRTRVDELGAELSRFGRSAGGFVSFAP